MQLIKLSESTAARRRIPFFATDIADGVTAKTGLTFAAAEMQISENGAAYANGGGTVTEVGSGLYYYECATADIDTLGFLTLKLNDSLMTAQTVAVQIVAFDPYAAGVNVVSMDAGVITAAAIATGAIDADALAADAGTEIAAAVAVNLASNQGTASAGGASTITLASGSATADLYNGQWVRITSGTGAGQARRITDYTGAGTKVATVSPDWTTTPDATSVYDVIYDASGLADDSIKAAAIATGAITAAKFAAGAIDASAVADNAIDAAAIATGAITAAKFAAGAIDAAAIASSAITDTKIATGALTAAKFAAGAIDAAALAADAATEIATAVLAAAYESTVTVKDFFRLAGAVLYGKASGLEGGTHTFRDYADAKDRVVATYSAGARTPTTRDAT